MLTLGVVLTIGLSAARAEPTHTWSEVTPGGSVTLSPRLVVWPSRSYGGEIQPGLCASAGLFDRFDLVAGATRVYSLYYKDDGDLIWGSYMEPRFDVVDLEPRFFLTEDLALTAWFRPVANWLGDVQFAQLGLQWRRRGEWMQLVVDGGLRSHSLTPVVAGPGGRASLEIPLGDRLSLFGELALAVMLETVRSKGGSGEWVSANVYKSAHVGAWMALGKRTGLSLGPSWDGDEPAGEWRRTSFEVALRASFGG